MLSKVISSFIRDEEGASAVEYGLIVGLIAVAIVATLILVGGDLDTLFVRIQTELQDAATP